MPTEIQVRKYSKFVTDVIFEYGWKHYDLPPETLMYNIHFGDHSYQGKTLGGVHPINKDDRKPWVHFNFKDVTLGQLKFKEYEHIESDPEIGTLYASNWKEYVTAIVCHEIAHCIDHYARINSVSVPVTGTEWPRTEMSQLGHEHSWQSIYRFLRNRFVNHTHPMEIPDVVEKYEDAASIGTVEIQHGFAGTKFVRGIFELIADFEPTDEAVRYTEMGIPAHEGYIVIRRDEDILRVLVRPSEHEIKELTNQDAGVIVRVNQTDCLKGFL
jgi:predicted SprT family Zn-dependent metalloprotease